MQPRAPKLLEDIRSAADFVRDAITDDLVPLLHGVEALLETLR